MAGVGQSFFERRHAFAVGAGNLQAKPGVEQVGLVVNQGGANPDNRRSRSPVKVGAVLRHDAVERVALGISDQACIDTNLAAKHHEQPRTLGPDSLSLGGHATQQHVVRPGIDMGQPPACQGKRRHELDLPHHPIEDPANPFQVFTCPRHPGRDPIIHHAVFEVPSVAQSPVPVLDLPENLPGNRLARYSRAAGSS